MCPSVLEVTVGLVLRLSERFVYHCLEGAHIIGKLL